MTINLCLSSPGSGNRVWSILLHLKKTASRRSQQAGVACCSVPEVHCGLRHFEMRVLRLRLAPKAPNAAQDDRSIYIANFRDITLDLKDRPAVSFFPCCWRCLRV